MVEDLSGGNVKRRWQKRTPSTQLKECLGSCTHEQAILAQGGPACLAVAAAAAASKSDTRAEKPQRDKKEEEEKKRRIWIWTLSVSAALSRPYTSGVPPPQAVIIQLHISPQPDKAIRSPLSFSSWQHASQIYEREPRPSSEPGGKKEKGGGNIPQAHTAE